MDVNDKFNDVLLDLTEQGKNIVLDIANVDFISSTGFGVIANCNGKLKQEDNQLIILSPTNNVQRVFEILDFKHILPILNTPKELKEYFETIK
ncbi:STAS domain-containing protein [bacterium]|nr:STAS domain-containing protein [bacterium]